MKLRPFTTGKTSSRHDARIDAVLQSFAHAEPAPGLESRVAARLVGARTQPHFHPGFDLASGLSILRRLGAAAVAVGACAAIVVGSVQHSERAMPPQAARSGQSKGLSSANGIHVPTRAMPKSAAIDPAAPRSAPHDRARVSRDQARHATGAAVPRSPYPPGQQPASGSNPQQ